MKKIHPFFSTPLSPLPSPPPPKKKKNQCKIMIYQDEWYYLMSYVVPFVCVVWPHCCQMPCALRLLGLPVLSGSICTCCLLRRPLKQVLSLATCLCCWCWDCQNCFVSDATHLCSLTRLLYRLFVQFYHCMQSVCVVCQNCYLVLNVHVLSGQLLKLFASVVFQDCDLSLSLTMPACASVRCWTTPAA